MTFVALQQILHFALTFILYDVSVEQLGNYLLIEKLGGGSAGLVYKAQDRRQGRIVALKVIRNAQKPLKAKDQFEREFFTSQRLKHPHIANLESIETLDDGRLLIVMPFLDGKTLDKLLIPISFREALSIITQTAQGLTHAHQQGIIHCDIKPANLMLIKGQVKILDFGLSRLQEEVVNGEQLGTLEYMSPEAARGQRLNITSDLWSLGVVFYELLVGTSPFQATNVITTLRNIAEHEPAYIGHIRSGLPETLDHVLHKLLSKKQEGRYSSSEALLMDLQALQDNKPIDKTLLKVNTAPSSKHTKTLCRLPEKPKVLLGRENELALISLYLQDRECRLLTLRGMGGMGKTHLSLWATHQQAAFEQCVFEFIHFIELATIKEAGFVAALANTLEVENEITLHSVAKVIGTRKQLLVLDNFEHLTSRAFMLETLLGACPNLTLFITTRERLALDTEWVIPLQGLSLPSSLPQSDQARSYAALALFEYHAKQQNAAFDLGLALESTYTICSSLHGHPLGIALAATSLNRLSIQELAANLEQSFKRLEDGTGRHRSLKAIFDQSYTLLAPEQKKLFASLSIFEGGFDLQAAHDVTDATSAMLDALLDSSLLELSIEGRYSQHPVLHSFSKDILKHDGKITKRHETYFLGQLKRLKIMLQGTEQSKAFERLERDFANFQTAIKRHSENWNADVAEPFRAFFTHKGRYAEGWELFSSAQGDYARVCTAWFALMLGNLEEAETLSSLATKSKKPQTQVIALNTQAGILAMHNEFSKAKEKSLQAISIAQQLNNLSMLAVFTGNIAQLEEKMGNTAEAISYYKQSLELSEKLKNHAQTLLILNNLADYYLVHHKLEKAKSLIEKALLLSEKSGLTRMKPLLQANFGLCLYAEGDYINAEVAYLEAYQTSLERGDEIEAVSAKIYLGQTIAAQGNTKKGKDTLLEALETTLSLSYTSGILSVIVRFSEIFSHEHNPIAEELATLVYNHPLTETGDRYLAEKIARDRTTNLKLEEAVSFLLNIQDK